MLFSDRLRRPGKFTLCTVSYMWRHSILLTIICLLPFSIRYVIAVDMNDEDCVNLAKNHDVMGAESWKWFAANKTCAPTNSTGHAIFGMLGFMLRGSSLTMIY